MTLEDESVYKLAILRIKPAKESIYPNPTEAHESYMDTVREVTLFYITYLL